MRHTLIIALGLAFCGIAAAGEEIDDPYLWLEEIQGDKALAWVEDRSAKDTATLEAVPVFDEIHAKLLEIYNSSDRIPSPAIRGAWIYNYWRDADHVRGIWRRTFLDEYTRDNPSWETVLDLDRLAEAEGENWVWKGANCLPPDYRHCMITLSRGGSDAAVEREFDTTARSFVENGFTLPQAKAQVSWRDADTLWVGTDFGAGSLTTSGYPLLVKLWSRGTPLDQAATVYTGSVDDVAAAGFSDHGPEGRFDFVLRVPEFYRGTTFLRLGDRLVKIDTKDGQERLLTKPDQRFSFDPPISREAVIGRVVEVRGGNRHLHLDSPIWRGLSYILATGSYISARSNDRESVFWRVTSASRRILPIKRSIGLVVRTGICWGAEMWFRLRSVG